MKINSCIKCGKKPVAKNLKDIVCIIECCNVSVDDIDIERCIEKWNYENLIKERETKSKIISKYRAWLPKKKMMVPVRDISFGDKYIGYQYEREGCGILYTEAKFPDIILMQNVKIFNQEYYEDDLCEFTDCDLNGNNDETIKVKIAFEDGEFLLIDQEDNVVASLNYAVRNDIMEKIGNIHENLELWEVNE